MRSASRAQVPIGRTFRDAVNEARGYAPDDQAAALAAPPAGMAALALTPVYGRGVQLVVATMCVGGGIGAAGLSEGACHVG